MKKDSHSPEEFVTTWPLYTPFDVTNFELPDRISYVCPGVCSKETTWVLRDRLTNQTYKWAKYGCGLCENEVFQIFFRDCKWKTTTVSVPAGGQKFIYTPIQIQKIGQFPALSINVPKNLEKNLGEKATNLYKKALANRNEGYGLGAVTYIRRVVEDKTDELIEVVAQLAESHNVDAKSIEKIRAAKNERTTYDNKLRIAATVLPSSLTPDGANPLGELYDLVSKGVHDLSEEECIAVADETQSVFEFTFSRLRAEAKERSEFVEKVKKWAGGKSKSSAVYAADDKAES